MREYFRGREGAEFLERQVFVLIFGALALATIFGDGRADIAVERWFYDEALRGFPLINHWLLKDVLHDAARAVSAAAALALCAIAAAAWAAPRRLRLRTYRRELAFAAVASLTATLAVGALKHFSGHACPWDLAGFGGTAAYHPLLSLEPAAAVPQGCLPAAHPLSGYAWLAVGFVFLPHAPRLARRAWQLAFLLGTFFGAVQVARGAHFPSHVLWTAWVSWAVNVALLTAYARIPVRTGAERSVPVVKIGSSSRS